MKKFFIIILILSFILGIFVSCGDDSGNNGEKKVEIAPEMKEFMNELSGDYKKVTTALNKYGVSDLDTDMGDFNLEKPEVIETEKKDGGVYYTMHVKSGATTRAYVLFWKDGKIQSVEYKGFVF